MAGGGAVAGGRQAAEQPKRKVPKGSWGARKPRPKPNEEVHKLMVEVQDVIQKNIRGRRGEEKYHPGFCHLAREMILIGGINVDLARVLGASVRKVAMWRHEHPEFGEAVHEAHLKADAQVEAALFKRACGYDHPESHVVNGRRVQTTKHVVSDTAASTFWLRVRQPKLWRDQSQEGSITADDIAKALQRQAKATEEEGEAPE